MDLQEKCPHPLTADVPLLGVASAKWWCCPYSSRPHTSWGNSQLVGFILSAPEHWGDARSMTKGKVTSATAPARFWFHSHHQRSWWREGQTTASTAALRSCWCAHCCLSRSQWHWSLVITAIFYPQIKKEARITPNKQVKRKTTPPDLPFFFHNLHFWRQKESWKWYFHVTLCICFIGVLPSNPAGQSGELNSTRQLASPALQQSVPGFHALPQILCLCLI